MAEYLLCRLGAGKICIWISNNILSKKVKFGHNPSHWASAPCQLLYRSLFNWHSIALGRGIYTFWYSNWCPKIKGEAANLRIQFYSVFLLCESLFLMIFLMIFLKLRDSLTAFSLWVLIVIFFPSLDPNYSSYE